MKLGFETNAWGGVVRKYADRIRYIHLKDSKDGNFLPLNEGVVDFEGILDALRAHNFDDWITIEQDGYTGSATEGAIRSREYLEALINLAPSLARSPSVS